MTQFAGPNAAQTAGLSRQEARCSPLAPCAAICPACRQRGRAGVAAPRRRRACWLWRAYTARWAGGRGWLGSAEPGPVPGLAGRRPCWLWRAYTARWVGWAGSVGDGRLRGQPIPSSVRPCAPSNTHPPTHSPTQVVRFILRHKRRQPLAYCLPSCSL